MTSILSELSNHDYRDWTELNLNQLMSKAKAEHSEGDAWTLRAESPGSWSWRLARRQEYDSRNGYGEVTSLLVTRKIPNTDADREYHALLAEAVAIHGKPSMVGGPGAWVKWRDPDSTTITISRHANPTNSFLQVKIVPTEASENERYRDANYGEGWEPDETWEVRPEPGSTADNKLLGMMSWPRSNTADWGTLTTNIQRLFVSLNADLPVLAPHVRCIVWTLSKQDGPWIAQGWFSDQESQLEIPDIRLTSRVEHFEPDTGNSFAQQTTEALRRAVQTPKQLRYNAFATGDPIAYVNGFGVPHEDDPHPEFDDENSQS